MTNAPAAPRKLTLDGVDYPLESLSPEAREILGSLEFVQAGLVQLNNELAISDTARLAYLAALRREMKAASA